MKAAVAEHRVSVWRRWIERGEWCGEKVSVEMMLPAEGGAWWWFDLEEPWRWLR